MMYEVYGVRDTKANMFWTQVMFEANEATAKRGFAVMINSADAKSILGFAPGDYDLYKLAEFDSSSGYFRPLEMSEFICNGRSVLEVS